MLVSIITTTINNPSFLKYYFDNLTKFNINNVKIIVVGDRKTDSKSYDKDFEYPIEYWDIDSQSIYLNKLSKNTDMELIFPENDPLRRNFGYLRAIELGSEVIITIDDDNLPIKCNFIGEHLSALNNERVVQYNCISKIINPCDFIDTEPKIFSRGYPITRLFNNRNPLRSTTRQKKNVMLNMGLWTNKPDTDSYFNIMFPDLYSKKYLLHHNVAVDEDMYFPVNTQNTAIKGDATYIFHNEYMDLVGDYPLHRFDDIWGGLFTLKVIHKNKHTASFGRPIVEHRRNTHNYSKDLQHEFMGISINEKIWSEVINMELDSEGYIDGYLEIASNLLGLNNVNKAIKDYIEKLVSCMELWIELVDKVR